MSLEAMQVCDLRFPKVLASFAKKRSFVAYKFRRSCLKVQAEFSSKLEKFLKIK